MFEAPAKLQFRALPAVTRVCAAAGRSFLLPVLCPAAQLKEGSCINGVIQQYLFTLARDGISHKLDI